MEGRPKELHEGDSIMFTVKNLTSSMLAYSDIQSQGFPNQIFDGEMLRPTGVFAVPGSPVAVFLTQANLVTGGLLLGMSVWHGAIDGTAILNYRNCGHRIAAPYKIQTDKILGPSPYLPMLSMHRVYRRSLALKEEE